MWSDDERLPCRDKPKKLKGKVRELEVMRILAQLKTDYTKLNKRWNIGCNQEGSSQSDEGNYESGIKSYT